MAGTLLVGWEGWRGVEYSVENAENLLENDVDCRDFISSFAMKIENFIRKDAEDLKKK